MGIGKSIREALFVDDLANAVVKCLPFDDEPNNTFAEPKQCSLINVGKDTNRPSRNVTTAAASTVGYKFKFVQDTFKTDGMICKVMDRSKIRNLG